MTEVKSKPIPISPVDLEHAKKRGEWIGRNEKLRMRGEIRGGATPAQRTIPASEPVIQQTETPTNEVPTVEGLKEKLQRLIANITRPGSS